MITEKKVKEIFCIMYELFRNLASDREKNLLLEDKDHSQSAFGHDYPSVIYKNNAEYTWVRDKI